MDPTDTDPSVQGLSTDGLANTSIISHAGKLLALEEAHAPFELILILLSHLDHIHLMES